MVHSLLQWLNKFARGTENLQLVVLSSAHHKPRVVLVPVKVANSVSEATVHEQAIVCQYVN